MDSILGGAPEKEKPPAEKHRPGRVAWTLSGCPGRACVPLVKEVVCRWGATCFHEVHFASRFIPYSRDFRPGSQGGAARGPNPGPVPIPRGACLKGLPCFSGLSITSGGFAGDCCQVRVSYSIRAVVGAPDTGGDMGEISESISLTLLVPSYPVPGPVCLNGGTVRSGARAFRSPGIYRAAVAEINGESTAVFGVELMLGCFGSGEAIVCRADTRPFDSCAVPRPTPPTSSISPGFVAPTACLPAGSAPGTEYPALNTGGPVR